MRLMTSVPCALAFALIGAAPTWAAPKEKPAADGAKKSGKEISTDDKALDKQMDWEKQVLGPNTVKKIDLAKIQKLQAEEMARREKQEKVDQAAKDRKEREEEAAAAAQRNTKAPSTRDVPSVPEPPPAKPAEKHDDAFVDKVLHGKGEKKKVSVTNDEVDQLLNKAKQEKGASITPAKGGKGKDTVDQLLATADKQASIKTTARKPADATEAVSAEAAAREATLKAIAAAAAKAQDEKNRNKKPAVPDAAMLRAQAAAAKFPASPPARTESPKPTPASAGWTDPFASDSPSRSSKGRGKVAATAAPPPPTARMPPAASGRPSPSTRPAANEGWQDPFDTGGGSGSSGSKPRPAPAKAAPAGRPGKRPPNWKDPFA